MVAYFKSFTVAERLSILTLGGLMVLGALLGYWAFAELQPMIDTSQPLFSTAWQVGASMCGAGIAARSTNRFFGTRGGRGIARAVLGATLGTLAYGIVAGTIILPVYGTMFAPWFVVLTLFTTPALAVLWVAGWAAYNFARTRYEDERDTIFTGRPSVYADTI